MDFSVPNSRPGICAKCRGTGLYAWGTVNNGRPSKIGPCHACRGTGKQTVSDIARNKAFNRHQMSRLANSGDY